MRLSPPRRFRSGFTLVELLTVIAIISILVSLLLPAVQKARELVNRLKCQNNMRQVGIAMHSYLSNQGTLPTAGESFDPSTGAVVFDTQSTFLVLLPYIEQGDVIASYDMTQSYNATAGNKAAAKTPIPTYLCPTNPIRSRSGLDSLGYGITDYMPVAAAALNPNTAGNNPVHLSTIGLTDLGALRVPAAPISVVVDGTSKTIGMMEDVGRSEHFYAARYPDPVAAAGGTADLLPSGSLSRNSFRWAEPASATTVGGPTGAVYPATGSYTGKILNNNASPFGGPTTCLWTTADCGPNDEPFSFHGGGVNCLFMDGHVNFIRDDIDPIALRRLLTAQEGLASGYTDY